VNNRVWINNRQPQTLYISQIMLYIRGAMGVLFGPLGAIGSVTLFGSGVLATIWILVSTIGALAAAFGIANSFKWGYRLGVAAALAPFVLRIAVLLEDGLLDALAHDPLSLIFDVAILAALLHKLSAQHQRIYFT
jgi:hypothetical protein